MSILLGLQTITWGDPQHDRMDAILATAAAAGYAGVEIGWRRVSDVGVDRLGELLERHGLELAASHVGGNLVDVQQADTERQDIDPVLDGLDSLRCGLVLYSGLKYESDAQLAREIDHLNAAAERCAARGVRLCYHNHDWEFDHGQAVYRALIDRTADALAFCPDVGWLHKAGQDCLAVLDAMRPRLAALHFKDFRTRTPGVADFCCLGEGCVPFEAVLGWVRRQGLSDFWIIAEQDEHDGPPEQAVQRNAAYLARQTGREATR